MGQTERKTLSQRGPAEPRRNYLVSCSLRKIEYETRFVKYPSHMYLTLPEKDMNVIGQQRVTFKHACTPEAQLLGTKSTFLVMAADIPESATELCGFL